MSLGDRAALEGIVAQCQPRLAVEIGTAQGGSLERIAAHSVEVHAVDRDMELLAARPPNATLHEGDSRLVVPELLEQFAAERRNVDLALVDGDHSPEGVRADLEALLSSPAVGRTIILLHDSYNPGVRSGIAAADPAARDKVVGVEWDFIPGGVIRSGRLAGQLWGGFALVIVDDRPDAITIPDIQASGWLKDENGKGVLWGPEPLDFCDAYEGAAMAARVVGGENGSSPEDLERNIEAMRSSASWRLTQPLRALKGLLRRRGARPQG